MTISTIVQSDSQEVAQYLATRVLECLQKALQERGSATLVLAGGNTYLDVYSLLADSSDSFPWPQVTVYFGDERCVPPMDPLSNYGAIARVWFDQVPENQRPRTVRIQAELPVPRAVEIYEKSLPEQFDVVLLGVGSDGHTASLFPGSDLPKGRDVISTKAELAPFVPRISLTPQALRRTQNLIFTAVGSGKAAVVREVMDDVQSRYPVNWVVSVANPEATTLVLDQAAAAQLRPQS